VENYVELRKISVTDKEFLTFMFINNGVDNEENQLSAAVFKYGKILYIKEKQ